MEQPIKATLSRRTFLAGSAVAAAAAGLTLAGCGGGGGDTGSTTTTDNGAVAQGGTLTAAVAYETNNYLPPNNSSALAVGANWHVVEGLYELDMATYEPYAALAAGDPVEVSETEYEVTLRDGAKFSDGTDVKASDVVASYERTVGAEGALYLSMLDFIDSVEAKDDTTVTFKLAHPFSLVKERLALIKVVPESATDADLTKQPVGSGPWMYQSISESAIEFVPNEHYTGSKPAKADTMHWDIIKDDTARTTAMQSATVAVMENVPATVADQLTGAGAAVESVQGFNLPFLMFNTKKAPFDDARVRQAFFYAIDVNKLISNAMSGLAAPVKSFLPEDHANFHEASTVYEQNPDMAKRLLEEAGVTTIDCTLDTTDASWIKDLSPSIKEDLGKVGINVTIQEQASAALYSNRCDTDEEVQPFDVVLAPGDPTVFGNDPDLLMNWWYGDNSWTQKRSSWKGSAEYEQLHELMSQAVEATGSEQQELWNRCFDIIAEQVPLYPLFHRQMTTAYYESMVTGFKPISTTGLNLLDAAATA